MKKLCAVVIIFAASIVAVAVWFSPLAAYGTPAAYYDNVSQYEYDGVCYPADALCRVDFSGGAEDMRAALDDMLAVTVKEVQMPDGLVIVYALSPRVCAEKQRLGTGEEYNVMAACSGGTVSIGTPILAGCY